MSSDSEIERKRAYKREYMRKYRKANPEKISEINKKKYAKNPEKYKQMRKDFRKNNLEKVKFQERKYSESHREEKIKKYSDSKYDIFSKYSEGKPKCACCGEEEMYFLTIDHIEGRAKWGHEGYTSGKLYRFLIKNDYPKGFQVLCMNCNLAKGIYGKCPHEIMRKEESFARM
jgi:hypothetical protein